MATDVFIRRWLRPLPTQRNRRAGLRRVHQVDKYGDDIWPDENYAREVMQIFTLGLYQARGSQWRVAYGMAPLTTKE